MWGNLEVIQEDNIKMYHKNTVRRMEGRKLIHMAQYKEEWHAFVAW